MQVVLQMRATHSVVHFKCTQIISLNKYSTKFVLKNEWMKHITMNIFNEYRALDAKIEKQYIGSCCLAIT